MEGLRQDIQVDWVRMAQSVPNFYVLIANLLFDKGSSVSEAWRRDYQDEFDKERKMKDQPIESRVDERRGRQGLELDLESTVCAVIENATCRRGSVDDRLEKEERRSAPKQRGRVNQSSFFIALRVKR